MALVIFVEVAVGHRDEEPCQHADSFTVFIYQRIVKIAHDTIGSFFHAMGINAKIAQCRTALRHIFQAELGDVEHAILNKYNLRRQSRL
ncbi:MAG: hypothetical protein RLP44_10405 [Aggregatilineales bacterium]